MKFSRLKLTGFKSFNDQTELVMQPGLTGIVGPNGCGKSNLVEALRWVMGESSYKAMRAAGMDDVIFAGSGNRPGRNSAEVTLVLDNSDRTAPAALNHADVLEVTRRIEREAGSVYRVNNKEVRARDVQLLFADASTGAHSPALVRQGQIGELIAAKPVQRRALLEEAAGISGLHSRRHEAELRLRGAEQNLERVDDVVAQVEQQLEALKRQARLAVRYRSLSGEIRKAEAMLFHLRWIGARFAEKEAEAERARVLRDLADAQHLELEAQKLLFMTEQALQPRREREAAAGATRQRLAIAAEQLDEEARRAEARRTELAARLQQLEADSTREQALATESSEALSAHLNEKARLEAETAGERQAFKAAEAETDALRLEAAAAEQEARAAADVLAQLRAQRASAEREVGAARQRLARLEAQLVEIQREASEVAARLTADEILAGKRTTLKAAKREAASAEEQAVKAEAGTIAAQAAAEAVRPGLQSIEATLNRLEAEAQTLAKVLNRAEAGRRQPVADQLQVTPGHETALGAALGDDLDASSDPTAPLHWAAVAEHGTDPELPEGATPMSGFVSGSELLKRRLDQIGLVSDASAAVLAKQLVPGQRLVTLQGALWRWDGLVAAANAPSAAAARLAQRNRLADLGNEVAATREVLEARRAEERSLAAALQQARSDERLRRDAWRLAQRQISMAQAEVETAQKASTELTAKQSALEEARLRLDDSMAEAGASLAAAEAALTAIDDEAEAARQASACQAKFNERRERAEQSRLRLAGFAGAARMRDARLAQIDSESAAWARRREGAAGQLATLELRRVEITSQLGAVTDAPNAIAERRRALDSEISAATQQHREARDELSEAENRHREAGRAQRAAADALSGLREQSGRIEERLKGLLAQRLQIERQVQETLGIGASQTAQAAGVRPEHQLPTEARVEQQVERLKAERERLGGVNLAAERESEEVQEKLDTMIKDRDDLIAAIAKLRAGIQSLNREGRARLNEAFDKVNGHFRELFTTLFGGGTAELSFVESDDPLEAGLEIIARPPGKKPTTMTLLSGGEQALTAMSLIFAVFLTNPAPICVLDEVDAPLDDANVERFCTLLDTMTRRTDTRFLVITHNPITMSRVDRLFGVTMAERGVSQLVSVDLQGAAAVVREPIFSEA